MGIESTQRNTAPPNRKIAPTSSMTYHWLSWLAKQNAFSHDFIWSIGFIDIKHTQTDHSCPAQMVLVWRHALLNCVISELTFSVKMLYKNEKYWTKRGESLTFLRERFSILFFEYINTERARIYMRHWILIFAWIHLTGGFQNFDWLIARHSTWTHLR